MLKSYTNTDKYRMSEKWNLVVSAYEDLKNKRGSFSSVEGICEAFKVHRKDIRKYYERWVKSGKNPESLLPQKRGPKLGQLKILSKEEERIIVNINRKLGANEFEIFELIGEYKNNGSKAFRLHPSVSTIYRTFKRYPLNKARKEKIKRYEKKYPGELVHIDTMVLNKTVFLERQRYYLFGAIDDCTRLCFVALITQQTAVEASRAFLNAYKWFHAHGIKIETILTDNGSEFTCFNNGKRAGRDHFFETMISMFNVSHKYTRPYRPQTNGKIERFWKLLKQECIRLISKTISKKEFIEELTGFMYRYNYLRRHGGLNYKTPLDKLRFVTEIMK